MISFNTQVVRWWVLTCSCCLALLKAATQAHSKQGELTTAYTTPHSHVKGLVQLVGSEGVYGGHVGKVQRRRLQHVVC